MNIVIVKSPYLSRYTLDIMIESEQYGHLLGFDRSLSFVKRKGIDISKFHEFDLNGGNQLKIIGVDII